jgi:hypothetical protein
MFCYRESLDNITPSKEHLLSKPVAAAFRIDRASPLLRTNSDLTDFDWRRLDGIKFGCVCTRCNNGWMNRLETAMGGIAEWLHGDPDVALGPDLNLVLRKWAMKSHMLLCFIAGNASHFGEDDFPGEYVVPPFTPAREMYEDDEDLILNRSAVGIARSGGSRDFIWTFGFPTAKGGGPPGSVRFAPATILTVGNLQLWVVTPLRDAEVSAPTGVISCSPTLRPRDLATLGHPLDPATVVVEFA